MAYQPKFARKNHRVSPFFVLLGVIVVPISLALTAVLLGKMAQSLSRPKATAQAAPENMAIMAQFDGFVSAKMDAARDTLTAAQTPENVPEATVPVREKVIIEIPDDAQVAPDLVFLDVCGVNGNEDLHVVLQLLEHPDLAVRLESRQHPGGVVVGEQLAAELQIQLAAELGDALFDLLGLGGEVLLIVKTDGRHTIFPFSLWLFKIR